ncbi:hypothetical protein FR943_24215 [Mycobacterium sp. TNTM28]|uniref:DUF4190 domain-containing protein n=1 Tax=[Mycobacterium] fortunisiensis TaxID=2600579 RepID=A0ABS6KTN1_9MYCO|nr:hypothetical protein [[Mycobacterium] fortunisiensis]MBU9766933.1 hypothetical protein [[Mycobacterium] fortunisiensis]
MKLPRPEVDNRYGAAGFLAALSNIAFLETVTWIIAPWWMIALIVLPVLFLIDLAISAIAAKGPSNVGQIGRGMMVGCMAAPLSLAIFIPIFLLAHSVGPL